MSSSGSRDYRGRGRHAADKYGAASRQGEDASSNLQPLNFDALGFDVADDTTTAVESGESFGDELNLDVAPEAAASQDQPPKRYDLDTIMTASTSQLVAIAVEENKAAQPAEDVSSEEQPEAQADSGASAETQPQPEAAVESLAPADAEPGSAVEPAVDADAPPAADADTLTSALATDDEPPQDISPADYSRGAAGYVHRGGWRNLSTGKRIAVVAVVVVALIASILAGVVLALWQNAADDIAIKDSSVTEALTPVQEDISPYWMLVLGSDSRKGGGDQSRSDVMMLVRVDPNTPKVTMVSIPRDTKVQIEGYGTQKINAAYAYGGAALAISTVEEYAGVDISHYAEIYFDGLEDLVDGMGGIEVDVPEYCKYSDVELQPGVQTLTGHEALIFSRCRKTYSQGDFTRTKCQRILLKALVSKVLSQDVVTMTSTITKATQSFKTDISLTDLVSLATRMRGMTSKDFYSGMAPSTTGMVDGVSYTFTYINQWKLLMQKAENGLKPTLSKKEQRICGYESTDYNELDMSEDLPSSVQKQLKAAASKK